MNISREIITTLANQPTYDDAPAFLAPIAAESYTGKWSTPVRKGMRVTVWEACELAELAPDSAVFVSFGHVHGREMFGRERYVSDSSGNLHVYDTDGVRKAIHPAGRKLRIITR